MCNCFFFCSVLFFQVKSLVFAIPWNVQISARFPSGRSRNRWFKSIFAILNFKSFHISSKIVFWCVCDCDLRKSQANRKKWRNERMKNGMERKEGTLAASKSTRRANVQHYNTSAKTFVRFMLVQMSVCEYECVQNCGNLMNERHHSIVVFLYIVSITRRKNELQKSGNVYRHFLKLFFHFIFCTANWRVWVNERKNNHFMV